MAEIITAFTINVNHPESNYGWFTYNLQGDLFLSCDYGFYGFNWRSFGQEKTFEQFLAQCNVEYIFTKFDQNIRYNFSNGYPAFVQPHVKNLLTLFIKELKNKLQCQS